jgi:type IV secretion system protein TrbL
VQFLQQLVGATSQALDPGQLAIILVAVIILAVISHRLPHIVAGMVVGGGTNGAIGGVGIMTLFAAGMTGMSLAGRLGGAAAATAATGAGESAKMLQDRIAAAEIASQKNQTSASTDISGACAGSASGGSSGALRACEIPVDAISFRSRLLAAGNGWYR